MEFIDDNLPPAPARILDAGCGNGELADRLRRAGHHVTAIDIDPALEGPSICVADICTYQDDPFDVVVFSLSLHHVHSLEMALDRAAALLKPGGTLLVDEFAYERADAAIADTYFGVAGSLARWREHHRDLHTGATMIDAITRRFTVDTLSRVPYLHRYLENNALYDSESVLGFQLIATSKESVMPVIRTTRYTATVDLAELLTRRRRADRPNPGRPPRAHRNPADPAPRRDLPGHLALVEHPGPGKCHGHRPELAGGRGGVRRHHGRHR